MNPKFISKIKSLKDLWHEIWLQHLLRRNRLCFIVDILCIELASLYSRHPWDRTTTMNRYVLISLLSGATVALAQELNLSTCLITG